MAAPHGHKSLVGRTKSICLTLTCSRRRSLEDISTSLPSRPHVLVLAFGSRKRCKITRVVASKFSATDNDVQIGSYTSDFLTVHTTGSRASIFNACRVIVRHDMQTATYLLPYLVLDAVCHCTEEACCGITEEIVCVLDAAASENSVAAIQAAWRLGRWDLTDEYLNGADEDLVEKVA